MTARARLLPGRAALGTASLVLVLLSGSGASAGSPSPGEVVATAGGRPVYAGELADRLTAARHQLLMSPMEAVRQGLLEELIDRELAALDVSESTVVESLLYRATVEAAVDAWLARNYLREVIDPAAEVVDEDIREYIPPRFERVKVRHIVVATPEEAAEARREVLAGADFGDVARERSTLSTSGPNGGELGWFSRWGSSLYEKEEIEPLFELAPGEVSPVLQTKLGYEVFLVEDRADLTEEEIEEFLANPRRNTWLKKKEKLLKDFFRERGVEVDEGAVMRLFEDQGLPDETVLGRAGGWKLTAGFYRAYLAGIREAAKKPSVSSPQDVEIVVTMLLRQKALRQAEEKRGFFDDPGRREKLAAFREKTLIDTYFQVLEDSVALGEGDRKEYYRRHRNSIMMPPRVHLSILVFSEKDRAAMVHGRLIDGATWERMAEAYSIDSSSLRGGDLGWVPVPTLEPQIASAVEGLAPGEFTEPILSQGFHTIVRLMAREASRPAGEEEARPLVEREALLEKRERFLDDHFAGLRKKHPVTVNEKVLKGIAPDESAPPVPPLDGRPPGHPH